MARIESRALVAAAFALMPLFVAAQRTQTNSLTPPTLVTTTLSTTSVHLSWSHVAGAGAYDIYRRANGGPFSLVSTVSWNAQSYTDGVAPNTTYFYQVVARNGGETAASNIDLATTVLFTDDPVQLGVTWVSEIHVAQLRVAVNLVRRSAALGPATWTNATLTDRPIASEDIEDLRTTVNQARPAAGLPSVLFSDAPLIKGSTLIRKVHVKELRQAVKGIQPEGLLVVSGAAVTEPYFSPNGDAVKDTTRISANISSADSTWTLSVRSVSGNIVRVVSGFGGTVNYVWDGRDAAGNSVADGTYSFAIDAVDGVYSASSMTSAVVDTTAPTATFTAPLAGQTYSNVRQNGSTTVTASGTATDTNFTGWDVAWAPVGAPMTTFGTGTSAVSNGQFGVWTPDSVVNGAYTVRLQVRDRAGNVGVATADITLAHFSASQNVFQANPPAGETVTYTSVVPFPVTETLIIRNSAGSIVRTLVNAARLAGTYTDAWNGRDDGNAPLPDGLYSYTVAVTEEANSFTWDQSTQPRGNSATQYPYPSCSARAMPLDTCQNQALAGRQYDPYTNDPLHIHYSVAEPSRVSVILTTSPETGTSCGGSILCIVNAEYRATGQYVETWSGVTSLGGYETAARPYITVVRRTDTFPKNVVIFYGSLPAVRVKNLVVTPPLYSPEGGSMKIEVDLETFRNSAATVTMKMVRQDNGSTLRTVTLNEQAPGRISYTWDGKATSGHFVAAGDYGLVVTAAIGGLSSTVTARFVVIY